jgi:hypothetical protein
MYSCNERSKLMKCQNLRLFFSLDESKLPTLSHKGFDDMH